MPEPNDPNVDPIDGQPTGQPAGNEPEPTEEQIPENIKQYLKSGLGRLFTEMKEMKESFNSANEQKPQPTLPQEVGQPSALDSFNEQLSDKLFGGDVLGAIQMANDVMTRAKTNLSQAETAQLTKALTSYSDEPLYKDIHQDANNIAKEALSNGATPEQAAELGISKAKAKALEAHLRNPDTVGLTFESGSKRLPQKTKTKLPPQFKIAADRDIAKGIFDDYDDYIASLSPQIKKQHGIAA